MVDRLTQQLISAKRHGATFAVLFMNIDRFKEFNDSHGHEFGDLLLRAVAHRLRDCVRQSDTVARIGGDEFVVILEAVPRVEAAETVARHVEHALGRPMTVERRRVRVTASIGISFYPDNGEDVETMLRAADSAMYQAKKDGGDRHVVAVAPAAPVEG